jgi:hypothetical protein
MPPGETDPLGYLLRRAYEGLDRYVRADDLAPDAAGS